MGLPQSFRDTSGAVAAEMALILPAIAFVLLNVVDLSLYIYTKMQVDLAAHEAVGAARARCDTAAELPATVNCGGADLDDAMISAAGSTTLGSTVTIASTIEKYYCASASGTLDEVALTSETPPPDCSATVGGSTSAPGLYINTTASHSFNPVFPGATVAALLPATITRTAWMRLK